MSHRSTLRDIREISVHPLWQPTKTKPLTKRELMLELFYLLTFCLGALVIIFAIWILIIY